MSVATAPNLSPKQIVCDEAEFRSCLRRERKRTERSGSRFVLILLEWPSPATAGTGDHRLGDVLGKLTGVTRESNVAGWYRDKLILGVLCTDLGGGDTEDILDDLFNRVMKALSSSLSNDDMTHIRLAFQMFPENNMACGRYGTFDLLRYADQLAETDPRRASLVVKAASDLAVSCLAVIATFPLLCAIALAVRLTSPGPVLFRQQRIGRNGTCFTFLKFRSMYASSDETIHKQYVEGFMSGSANGDERSGRQVTFKLKNDPRVTRLGRFLRKTSLDELPQLFNVLRGEMSLVGPRPPVPYEFERYELWHRRRLLNVTPGITGLWQVGGRSRVTFEEMVRLDLTYLDTWSLWLDFKILLRTPAAVLSGEGAY